MGKIKGIEITDLRVGAGTEATNENAVFASVRTFLRRGEEVDPWPGSSSRMLIDLSKRDAIAGLRYGIPGMRVGGIRQILMSPHLAYGETGIPGMIPANALIRCEVELLEVREHGALTQTEPSSGKSLLVTSGGGAVIGMPWWQFSASEDGRCGVGIVRPRPGLHWRNTRREGVEISVTPDEISLLISLAIELPERLSGKCVPQERLWSGTTEQGYPFTFGGDGDKPCITVNVYELRQTVSNYSIQEDCAAFLDSEFFQTTSSLIRPHLEANHTRPPQTRHLPD
jgi:hypothetical protein